MKSRKQRNGHRCRAAISSGCCSVSSRLPLVSKKPVRQSGVDFYVAVRLGSWAVRTKSGTESQSPPESMRLFHIHLPVADSAVVNANDFAHALCLRAKGSVP